MKTASISIAIAVTLFTASCSETPPQDTTTLETAAPAASDVETVTSTDKNGKTLQVSFNNPKGTATLQFEGETIELQSQKPASGIWYKNDRYELRGKGADLELTKDGVMVFEHQDDKSDVVAKNDRGDVLNMTFNNTDGTVKAYLNGGEQIDLVAEKAASGIWYKNDQYELSGKGDHYTLTQYGKTVFEN